MTNQKLLEKTIREMQKQIKEQQEIIDRLERCLKPIGKIEDFNRIEINGTSNYEDECPASKLW